MVAMGRSLSKRDDKGKGTRKEEKIEYPLHMGSRGGIARGTGRPAGAGRARRNEGNQLAEGANSCPSQQSTGTLRQRTLAETWTTSGGRMGAFGTQTPTGWDHLGSSQTHERGDTANNVTAHTNTNANTHTNTSNTTPNTPSTIDDQWSSQQ